MAAISPVNVLRRKLRRALIVVLSCGLTLSAQLNVRPQQLLTPQRNAAEQKTASYFESIRKSPPRQMAFLLRMPKGADLHNHLSGGIYAERYIEWAGKKGLCLNTSTMTLVVPSAPSKCAT